ncbi:hypothetical protein CDCA_CDCA04G1419 [Cyanidium caldarium]|uniref:Ubiquinone biosynthesis protein COQ4 homolog, mitochondrial n=1 Tax=Cyanidium caldarium TaxID=2771 RepID=A0AAV9ISX1_CYACA|nr:hypothetical protein CDCA_CDCA04G1419 [Cyanidium caldarium]
MGEAAELSRFGRVVLSVASAVGAFANPARADLIAALGETAPGTAAAVERLARRMRQSDEGGTVLRERPRIKVHNTKHLAALPENTFGRQYAEFMRRYGFRSDERAEVRFVDDDELAYVIQRYRECHDLWHVLNNLPPTLLGEVTQKYFEAAHTGLPMAVLSAVVGPLRLRTADRNAFLLEWAPWAGRNARRCADLMSVYYERHWSDDLQQLRRRLRITPATMADDGSATGVSAGRAEAD